MGELAVSLMFASIFLGAASAVSFWIANTHPAPSQTLLIPVLIAGIVGAGVFFVASVLSSIIWLVT